MEIIVTFKKPERLTFVKPSA